MNFLETREAILAQIGDKWTSGFDISVHGVPLINVLKHLDKLEQSGLIWKRVVVRALDAAEVEYCKVRDIGDPPIGKRGPMRRTWAGLKRAA